MTIQEAIDAARRLRDSEFTEEDMVRWLSAHDQNLYDRVLSKYGEGSPNNLPYTDYLESEAEDRFGAELMLPDKYGLQLYPLWLVTQIDLQHGDYDRYNNDATMYAALENAMKLDYSRERKWKPPRPEGWPDFLPYGQNDIRF